MTGTAPDDDFETIATTVGRRPTRPRDAHRRRQGRGAAGGEPGEVLVRGYSVMRGYLDDPEATARRDRRRRLAAHRRPRRRSTSAATCASSAGRRTCSSSAGSTPTRPRSRTCCSATRRSVRRRWSGCPTSGWARSAWRSSSPRPARSCDPDELIAWARDAMANYKVPRRVEIVDELPVNAAGKVEKDVLRAAAAGASGQERRHGHPVLGRAARAARSAAAAGRRPRAAARSPTSTTPARQPAPGRRRPGAGWFELRGAGRRRRAARVGRRGRRSSPRSWAGTWPTTPFLGPMVAADLARPSRARLDDAATERWRSTPTLAGSRARRGRRRAGRGSRGRLRGGRRRLDAVPTAAPTAGSPRRAPRPTPATDLTRRVAPVTRRRRAGDDARRSTRSTPPRSARRGAGAGDHRAPICSARWKARSTRRSSTRGSAQQYGVPIGSFQAVQHLLAEARVPDRGFDQRGAVRGVGGRRAAAG